MCGIILYNDIKQLVNKTVTEIVLSWVKNNRELLSISTHWDKNIHPKGQSI